MLYVKRAIVICSISWTIRIQRAVDRAFFDAIRVKLAVVDVILCAVQVK
jgi:hypothetical protein